MNLLNEPYDEVRSFLGALDAQVVENNAGLTSELLGIGIYAPSHMTLPSSPTQSVIVFEDGYYDH